MSLREDFEAGFEREREIVARRGENRASVISSIDVHYVNNTSLRVEITHREGNVSKRTVTIESQEPDLLDPHHPDAPKAVLIRALVDFAKTVLG